jgi:hypothetical protein
MVALVKTTGDYEGELGGGESIRSGEGVIVQRASPGLASFSGHVAILDEQRRDGRGRPYKQAQGKKVVGDLKKAEKQASIKQRRNERSV